MVTDNPNSELAEPFASTARRVGRRQRAVVDAPKEPAGFEVVRDSAGEISQVRIGAWRLITAKPHRRIIDVRPVPGERFAVWMELHTTSSKFAGCTLWELYDREGHLLSMLQDVRDREVMLPTEFREFAASGPRVQ